MSESMKYIFGEAPDRFNANLERALQWDDESFAPAIRRHTKLRSVLLATMIILLIAATAFAVYYKVIGDKGAYTVGSEIDSGYYVYVVEDDTGLFAIDVKNDHDPNYSRYHKPYGPAEYWMYLPEDSYISIKPEAGVLSYVNQEDIPKINLENVNNGRFFVGLQVDPGHYIVGALPETDRSYYRITQFENETLAPSMEATYFEMNGKPESKIDLSEGEVIEIVNCVLKKDE